MENNKREKVNIEEFLKDRGVLNIFTLNKEKYKSYLKEILLKNEKDLESLENNLENLDIQKNKKKNKKNKKKNIILNILQYLLIIKIGLLY